MKCLRLQLILYLICQIMIFSKVFAEEPGKLLTKKQVMRVAEMTPEVEALYGLGDGFLFNCIEKEIVRPCDTDWVSCVDYAWVARFTVGSRCPVRHDGRLNVHILIDERDGRIISRFPEAPYFKDPAYCLENYDCLEVPQAGSCGNFIHAQMKENVGTSSGCICQANQCQKAPAEKK